MVLHWPLDKVRRSGGKILLYRVIFSLQVSVRFNKELA